LIRSTTNDVEIFFLSGHSSYQLEINAEAGLPLDGMCQDCLPIISIDHSKLFNISGAGTIALPGTRFQLLILQLKQGSL